MERRQQDPATRELAQGVVEAGVWVNDADVGERRLGEDNGNVSSSELPLQRADVVELDHAGRLRRMHGWAEVAAPGLDAPSDERGERLVDGAVVTPVEDEDLGPMSDVAGETDREAVGVGRRERELPDGEPKASMELARAPVRVVGREHRRDAPLHLFGKGT